jgi:outer membrane receptor protein involved in Fe transport
LWSDTEFTESAQQPMLVGKPFPQAPDLRLIATAEWRPLESLTVFAGCDYGSAQYDDALATRRLPDYTSVRLGLSWRAGPALYQIRVENLFDEEIQTGLSSDGLRTYAAPRALWAGVEWEF